MLPIRDTRYQGAIIRNNEILLIKHVEKKSGRSYWIFPGGGIEPAETEEECVRREMKEETNLDIRIISLLLDEPSQYPNYRKQKTYLCEPSIGDAKPGFEPEPEAANQYSIAEVKWFNLVNETNWDTILVADLFTYGQLQRVRKQLGYLP